MKKYNIPGGTDNFLGLSGNYAILFVKDHDATTYKQLFAGFVDEPDEKAKCHWQAKVCAALGIDPEEVSTEIKKVKKVGLAMRGSRDQSLINLYTKYQIQEYVEDLVKDTEKKRYTGLTHDLRIEIIKVISLIDEMYRVVPSYKIKEELYDTDSIFETLPSILTFATQACTWFRTRKELIDLILDTYLTNKRSGEKEMDVKENCTIKEDKIYNSEGKHVGTMITVTADAVPSDLNGVTDARAIGPKVTPTPAGNVIIPTEDLIRRLNEPNTDRWVTSDGTSKLISKMTEQHLKNTIALIKRSAKVLLDYEYKMVMESVFPSFSVYSRFDNESEYLQSKPLYCRLVAEQDLRAKKLDVTRKFKQAIEDLRYADLSKTNPDKLNSLYDMLVALKKELNK